MERYCSFTEIDPVTIYSTIHSTELTEENYTANI